jgi:Leucine-rich repeat (LRR) protein
MENTELVINPANLPVSLKEFAYSQERLSEEQVNLITKRRLDQAYPDKKVKELDLRYEGLQGQLDLREYSDLEVLSCHDNYLTSLEISKNKQLKVLSCDNNQLTNLDIAALPASLTILDIEYNKLLNNNLTDFSHLVNLERLNLRNTQIKGSLESLQNLTKLR